MLRYAIYYGLLAAASPAAGQIVSEDHMPGCMTCSPADIFRQSHQTRLLWSGRLPTDGPDRRIDMAPLLFDGRMPRQISYDNGVTIRIEKNRGRKRVRAELVSDQDYRVTRGSFGTGYAIALDDQNSIEFGLTGRFERSRLMMPTPRGRSSKDREINVSGSWLRDHWRLSASYGQRRSFSQKTGLDRSIQLAAGGPANADRLSLGLDYGPDLALAMPLRIGIEAHSDRLSTADACAIAMAGRGANVIALRMAMGFR